MLAISVLHAISDAVASVAGPPVCPRLDAPATPERVLDAIDAPARARGMSERWPRACATLLAAGVPVVLVDGRRGQGHDAARGRGAMLVTADASFGTIGGGRLEWEATARARELLAERQAAAVLELPLGPAVGQCCGGHVTLSAWRRATAATLADARGRRGGGRCEPALGAAVRRRPCRPGAGAGARALAAAAALGRRPRPRVSRAARPGRRGGRHRPAAGR